MLVTVVVCAYNEEKYLERCLQAIRNQKVQPDELLVVDNASKDKTKIIAQKYADRVIYQPKRGISWAREMAFDKAKGDLIIRCDADCIPRIDWTARIIKEFETQKFDLWGGSLHYNDLKIIKRNYAEILQESLTRLLGHPIVYGPNMAITKDMWLKVRDQVCKDDNLIHEDIDLSIHVNMVGGKIVYSPHIQVSTSARRIKFKPYSFFIQYPLKLIETIRRHMKLFRA